MTDKLDNRNLPRTIFLITMVSLGWGFSFLFLGILLEVMAPAQMLAVRWTFTALEFLVLILIGKVRIHLKGKNLIVLLLPGLCEPCAYCILEAYGIKMTSISVSAIFVATIPCMTLVLGILFFHKKGDRRMLTGIILAFLGVFISTLFSPNFSLGGTRIGMICMLLAVIACSLYSLTSNRASTEFDATTITAVMAFEGAVMFDIILFCQGYGLDTFLLPFSDMKILINLLMLTVFCAYASYICYNRLMGCVEPALGNNIVSSISTIIGVVSGILIMGDSWGWYTIIGALITLVGVWMSSMLLKDSL